MPAATAPFPRRVVIVDIDALRRDVFWEALESGQAPHLGRVLGGRAASAGLHLEPVSNAPSITFNCQTSIFTGVYAEAHGVLGNQFFDRFGRHSDGKPRFYAFDVGETLAVDDAVRVFTGEVGLVDRLLSPEVTSLYERAAQRGLSSTVVYHMLARGATHRIQPSVVDLARFTSGPGSLRLSAEAYDGRMIDAAVAHLRSGARPDVLTVYFLGLDHHTHTHGPAAQLAYVTGTVDPLFGRLLAELEDQGQRGGTVYVVVSDHGQISVPADDRHSLRLGFPFDRELARFFDALGLDVHDLPGEAPTSEAVVAANGGTAYVYLRGRAGAWPDAPRFDSDVLAVARAFWDAHQAGRYARDLAGALAMVLVRNVEREGWRAPYQALAPDGQLVSVEAFLSEHPELKAVDGAHRLRHAAAPAAGDLLLVANYADGFYFGGPVRGVHGGLHREDSEPVLSFGWPDASPDQVERLREAVRGTVAARCRSDGGRRAGLVDMLPALGAGLGWD